MNREEAIETLENGAWWDMLETMSCDYAESVKFHAALDMAISALRAQQEPNAPLTLEELREMDGEPVWVVQSEVDGCWALISAISSAYVHYVHTYRCGVLVIKEYGETWWAYRRKPEEG